MAKKPLYQSLYFQVITAIIIGVLLGHFVPATGEAMKPFGDGFIKLIKMIIAPIIFCTVVVGIAGMEDMKKVGKTGGLALLYFEVVSSIALVVGLVIVNLVAPGTGMNVDAASLDTKGIAAYTGPSTSFPRAWSMPLPRARSCRCCCSRCCSALRCTSSAAAAPWCST
jgi:aerobic C4-dicarboxylate transport protein